MGIQVQFKYSDQMDIVVNCSLINNHCNKYLLLKKLYYSLPISLYIWHNLVGSTQKYRDLNPKVQPKFGINSG